MFRTGRPGRLGSIRRVWFRSLSLLLVLFFGLFIAFATVIIFIRADRNIHSLLDRALTITWEEYNQFFYSSTSSLTALADELETGVLPDYRGLAAVLNRNPAFDLWFVTDASGKILLAKENGDTTALQPLSGATQAAWQAGQPSRTSESMALDALRTYSPFLAGKAVVDPLDDSIQQAYGALLKVAAVPYRNPDHTVAGALVVAHLVNNDNSVANALAVKIPDSFSTISVNSIRISSNLSSRTETFLGKVQAPDHVKAIQAGQRYYGRSILANDLDHLIVSDPIRNAAGQVIGALTIGHPSQGLASLKQDTALYIGLSALVCWIAIFAGSALVAKRWAEPVMNLSKVAKRVYADEVIKPEHLMLVDTLPPANTTELEDLQLAFNRMAHSLYGSLQELEKERNELQRLTGELQDANITLEARVAEKTLELRNAMEDLAASSNAKSKLLSNTSHELRTPLNSIIGFSDMLTSGIYGELTDNQRNRIQIIGDSARYLLKLINDLLEVSLMQQGKMTLEKQWIDMPELVESVATIIRNDGERNHLTLTTEHAADLPLAYVDPTRIRQVLYNVVSNAVKFTPAGGRVAVSLTRQENELVIAVQDTGIGISENDQLYVFDEFYQGENTSYRKHAGFGLGLPLSKKLVELHGGRVALQSALGKGTTITIHLPLSHGNETEQNPTG